MMSDSSCYCLLNDNFNRKFSHFSTFNSLSLSLHVKKIVWQRLQDFLMRAVSRHFALIDHPVTFIYMLFILLGHFMLLKNLSRLLTKFTMFLNKRELTDGLLLHCYRNMARNLQTVGIYVTHVRKAARNSSSWMEPTF